LRDASDASLEKTGKRPQVFLASLGDLATHSSRTTWARNFFAAGGIEAIAGEDFHSSVDVGKAFADSGARVACICSSDACYRKLGEATAGALKAAGAEQILVAGRPGDEEVLLRQAGVDGFIYAGCDAVQTLEQLHRFLGVST
jgi:methylmalonyl-CoA mutase